LLFSAAIRDSCVLIRRVKMAEVVLFHHAQGLTPGVVAFAGELRRAGHTVHTLDLFEGRKFATIEEGMGYAEQIGFPDEVIVRGARTVEGLPTELVYAGFSLGVVPAQKLAQTRPGALGALLFYSCLFLRPGLSVRLRLARRSAGADTWDGRRPDLCRRRRHRRRSRARRPGRRCGALPLPRRPSTISPTAHCRHTTRMSPPC
jgi:hypothetical protein